jgi:hypothetical protein
LNTKLVTPSAAALAVVLLLHARPVPAQEASPSPAPAAPADAAAVPTPPPPSPLPILMEGPAHETLRSLAAALQTEAKHALEGAQAAAQAGRVGRMMLPGLRAFSRRTDWLRKSIDEYRQKPFDVVGTVDMMNGRVGMLARRMRRNANLDHTREDWDNITDVLDRMKKLLAGETVAVPPPHTPKPAPTPAAPAAEPSAAPAGSPTPSPTPPPD